MISCIILAGGGSKRMRKDSKDSTELSIIARAKSAKTKVMKKIKGDKFAKGAREAKAAMAGSEEGEGNESNKAFMMLNEKPLVMHVLDTVRKFFQDIVIVVKTPKQKEEMERLVADSSRVRVKVVADKSSNYSPVVGIKAGMPYAAGESVFVVGCDMPFINGVTIFQLMNKMRKGIDCVVPSRNNSGSRVYEPLCAIYDKRAFDGCMDDESIQGFIERCRKIMIPVYDEHFFFNVNTPEDLEKAELIAKGATKGNDSKKGKDKKDKDTGKHGDRKK